MDSQVTNNQPKNPIPVTSKEQFDLGSKKPFHFQTNFRGYMQMYGNRQTVARYFDAHQNWFSHCAQPMIVEPIGDNGYNLTVGRFGSFGYEVEAKISVVLQSLKPGVYFMQTIEMPNSNPLGYKVNYQAALNLSEISRELAVSSLNDRKLLSQLPSTVTKVDWELYLGVAVTFPKFIHKLPSSLIQKTGDRLLNQIVRQVSPRLTYRVQKDFHLRHNLPIPPKNSHNLIKTNNSSFFS
ncbi:MAG: DUF1997 domain-containing protein [Prochloraceae cyanobacterium]|nr:DUF1997 domain-containing protein [Prochloraceae cyanobacterium]